MARTRTSHREDGATDPVVTTPRPTPTPVARSGALECALSRAIVSGPLQPRMLMIGTRQRSAIRTSAPGQTEIPC